MVRVSSFELPRYGANVSSIWTLASRRASKGAVFSMAEDAVR
jgi:hypothetical protein